MIPQYEPQYNRKRIAEEVSKYILGDGFFSENTETKKFEEALADFLNVNHVIMTTNCTTALSLALLAEGIKPGDKVLIPNITMMSTQASVELIGAKPVFVDIDPTNLCMDLQKAKEAIFYHSNIKAVILVHLNGRSHSRIIKDLFVDYLKALKIKLIEDNAQAFGSRDSSDEKISCSRDGIGCFSLSFHKLLSTGQGGFCVTNNNNLATRLRELKNVGRIQGGADVHERFGINSKFTDIQAIIGRIELDNIYDKIYAKQTIYDIYKLELNDLIEIEMLFRKRECVPWFVDIYAQDRDKLSRYLNGLGIQTRNIYPELTSQKLNKGFLKPKHLQHSKVKAERGLWLPSSINLKEEEILMICKKIREFYGR